MRRHGFVLLAQHQSRFLELSQAGALFIGTYDAFALGNPLALVDQTSARFPRAADNRIVIIPQTGHTYQGKEQFTADALRDVVLEWEAEHKDARNAR